jgi:hypothetical protein
MLIIAATLVFGTSLAFAQAGTIGIYGDPGGTLCELEDATPGLCSYYVVHVLTPGATAAQFSAPAPACFAGPYLSDTAVFPVTIGSSQTGVAIGYGTCVVGPAHILTINYFCQGLTGNCCEYAILADPNVPSGEIEVVDCTSGLLFANGGHAVVNADGTCDCTNASEESTWGKVKSLFE